MVIVSRIVRLVWLAAVLYATLTPWLEIPTAGLVDVTADELLTHAAFRLCRVPRRAEDIADLVEAMAAG